MNKTGVLIVGHGSRENSANLEFEGLVADFQRSRPNFEVRHGYIELVAPALLPALENLAAQSDDIAVIPLFLFTAGHVKNDIPIAIAAARRRFPAARFEAARTLGVHPAMLEIACDRLRGVMSREQTGPRKTALIVVGRGASDPDANGDFCKLVRLLGEGRDFGWLAPCFIGVTRPSFEEAVETIARSRPERIVVLPYFLFSGRLIARLKEQAAAFASRYPWIKIALAPHLGVHPRLLDLVDERISETLAGGISLPCDNCHYRTPVSGVSENVGGLRALLWSVRHAVTHNGAMPHEHAHRSLSRHVLVCSNADCASRGGIALIASLRRGIREAGRENDIRVTRTSCMGRCGEGPTVAVYPDGVWYRGVRPADAAELVREHLLGDKIVGRLVDGIMQ